MVLFLDLPTELLCHLLTFFDNPSHYHQLCMIHPLLYRIGRSFNSRYSFLSRTLIVDDQEQHYRSILCRFLASSSIPFPSVYAIDLMELVPTSHFCNFKDYPDIPTKKYLLQFFRTQRQTYYQHANNMKVTIPTLVNKTILAKAMTTHRHRLIGGIPRRVYYHVTFQGVSSSSSLDPFFCLFHDTDEVVGFDKDLNCHHGKLWYEDEGIITDSSWDQLLTVGKTTLDYRCLRPSPVGYYDQYKTKYHRAWRPCLLKTLYQCQLKQDVRKGGLKKGDWFDCVFVYEHREDDTICLEFCQRDRHRLQSQGFLLFSEHHIEWIG
ncbi:uncharacterized protein BX664DRAFT_372091 [Halteromyces radiatus]|uniref:uncharacterized protein n=1 Tax=Halteromyces radiatus TaxID=101107 RepID=UPI0022202527|nr:uncharacterized protein BX664DRAFT_372091 [Halteromyces radiatus]KAI8093245.1 hypothetical protein BX664DRAFT_372091 [Halteromyces radiatus]